MLTAKVSADPPSNTDAYEKISVRRLYYELNGIFPSAETLA